MQERKEENQTEELLKNKRKNVLHNLIEEMLLAIRNNKISYEIPKKTFIYSRIADFTYYSEVSIRKFLMGAIPKDISAFVEGVQQYCELLKINAHLINTFIKEYTIACSAIILENKEVVKTKTNVVPQDLRYIVRNSKLTKFLDEFTNNINNLAYIYGYPLTGKTKSVLAYVYDLINKTNKFEYIFWIDVYNSSNIKMILTDGILKELKGDIRADEIEEELKMEIVLSTLKQKDVLLIVDLKEHRDKTEIIHSMELISQSCKCILIGESNLEAYRENLNEKISTFCMNEGMEKEEIKALLNLHEELRYLMAMKKNFVELIYQLTNGMPYASLYLAKKMVEENRYGNTLDMIIKRYEDFNAQGYEDLSMKMINETWEEISSLAKEILMYVANFSHSVSLRLIAYLCDASMDSQEWKEALRECYHKEILNHILLNNPRCTMNGMIKTLILSKIKQNNIFDTVMFHEKIALYYQTLSSQIGECYNAMEKMDILDELDEFAIVGEVLEKLYQAKKYEAYIKIDKNLKYYMYVRGYWKIGEESTRIKRAKLAKEIGNKNEELEAICDYINPIVKQKDKKETEKYLQMAKEIIKNNPEQIQRRVMALFNHVKALYLFNERKQYQQAYKLWSHTQIEYEKDISEYRKLVHQLWMDKCQLKMRQDFPQLYKEIEKNYEITLQKKFTRGKIDYELLLAELKLLEYKETQKQQSLEAVKNWLKKASRYLIDKNNLDRRNTSKLYRLYTVMYAYQRDKKKMYEYYDKTCEFYEKMNYQTDLKQFKKEIKMIEKES